MNQILLILHLLGFGAGVTSSIANFVVVMLLRASPGDAPVLSKIPPRLARVGQAGLGLLWLTGLLLVWTAFGGPQNLPMLFWWKFACVVGVTVLVGMMGMIVRRAQAGDRSGMARLPLYGGINAVLLLLVVVFAVYAFD